MEDNRLYIDGQILCKGLRQATSRSEEPVLCLIKPESIKFAAISGLRLVIAWEKKLEQPLSKSLAFLIPPMIAELLGSEVICGQVGVEFATAGQTAICRLTDHLGQYEIRWQSDLSTFPAPEAFSQIIQAPNAAIQVPYLKFSDAIHEAVAKLVQMEADQQVSPTKLAILIDLDFGRLRVNGSEIVTAESRQYYFDPRLVIRALEFAKERTLRVGITPLGGERRAYLSILTQEEDWTVHCSLLSIGLDTQRLYPLPPGRNR